MPPFNRSRPVNYEATDDLSPRGLSFGQRSDRIVPFDRPAAPSIEYRSRPPLPVRAPLVDRLARANPRDDSASRAITVLRVYAISGGSHGSRPGLGVSRLSRPGPWVIPATIERSIKSGTIRVIIRLLMTLTRYNEFETRSHKRSRHVPSSVLSLRPFIKFATFRFVLPLLFPSLPFVQAPSFQMKETPGGKRRKRAAFEKCIDLSVQECKPR